MKEIEQSLKWYNDLPSKEKRRLCRLYFDHVIIDPSWGEDAKICIDQIWQKETH